MSCARDEGVRLFQSWPLVQIWTAEQIWGEMVAGTLNLVVVVAINGDEELAGKRGETPTEHIMTRGRHRVRERSTANSPRMLSSMVRHGRTRATAEQMATAALGFHGGGVA